jgi:hypothetical protein
METLGQIVLDRQWNCIHGLSMGAPCRACLQAVLLEAETQRLQVAEQAAEEKDDGE